MQGYTVGLLLWAYRP